MTAARTLLVLCVVAFPGGLRAQVAGARRSLHIAESSLSLTLVTITLSPSQLTPRGELYTGSYQVRVSPIVIGSESGRMSVQVPEAALRRLERGDTVSFTGEAVSQSGKSRQVDARATPADADTGQVRLRITANGRKLVFHTGYRFGEP